MANTRQMALTPGLVARVHRALEDPGPNPSWAYHTDEDHDAVAPKLLASHPGGPDTWLFAYGSLIWRPELEHVEAQRGTARGWHRSFCFRLMRFRGTKEQPGLMISLNRGGAGRELRPSACRARFLFAAASSLPTFKPTSRIQAYIADVARRNECASTTEAGFRWAELFLPRGRFLVALGEGEMMDSLLVSGSLRRTVLAALLVAIGSGPLLAQTKPKVLEHGVAQPSSVIYIGNSFFYFNNGISGHVSQFLAAAGEKPLRSSLVTISGSGLDWHDVESYFRPNAVGRYTIGANNVVSFNKPERLFDIAIMMDCSQCPVHPDLKSPFEEYAKRHADTVRKHGAKPVFFMSWAYLDKPEMTEQLAQAYTRVGNENEALVIPAGLAFARAVAKRPEVNLYMPDKRHPTLAGTYLSAATLYGSIFRKSPVGMTYTAGLDPGAARFLQTVAWDTVQEYYGLTPTPAQQRVN